MKEDGPYYSTDPKQFEVSVLRTSQDAKLQSRSKMTILQNILGVSLKFSVEIEF